MPRSAPLLPASAGPDAFSVVLILIKQLILIVFLCIAQPGRLPAAALWQDRKVQAVR
jgi:hypothetical protein